MNLRQIINSFIILEQKTLFGFHKITDINHIKLNSSYNITIFKENWGITKTPQKTL